MLFDLIFWKVPPTPQAWSKEPVKVCHSVLMLSIFAFPQENP